jgi:hypothetical protein
VVGRVFKAFITSVDSQRFPAFTGWVHSAFVFGFENRSSRFQAKIQNLGEIRFFSKSLCLQVPAHLASKKQEF